jgi:solute carrier family 25 (mitochondrial aspartate/glutamate transporter), member 12/13
MSSKAATAKEAFKESLLGSEVASDVTPQTRATFVNNASKDEEGDLYMSREQFTTAIAPPEEDYVSILPSLGRASTLYSVCRGPGHIS